MLERFSLISRSLLYAAGFFVTLIWLLPSALGIRLSRTVFSQSLFRQLGFIPLLLGAAIAFWCVANFVKTGRGTPAPFDAPRKLVVTGLYCHVRNPMYLGGFLFLMGFAVLVAEFSAMLIWYGLGLLIAVNLFVFFYEEPTLRRKFDGDYEEYCRAVSRWIPNLHAWRSGEKKAAATGS